MCPCCEGSDYSPRHSATEQVKLEHLGDTLEVSDDSIFERDK